MVLQRIRFSMSVKDFSGCDKVEQREVIVFKEPMFLISGQRFGSAGETIRHINDKEDLDWIVDYTPYYVVVVGACELESLPDVKRFYERNFRAEILDWHEV